MLGLGLSGVLTWLHRILGLAPRPLFVALRVVPVVDSMSSLAGRLENPGGGVWVEAFRLQV